MDDKKFEKFTWRIEKFSRLNSMKLYSEIFVIGGYPWRILLFPSGNGNDVFCRWLSIYLVAADNATLPEGWNIDATLRLSIFDQVNSTKSIMKETAHLFNAREKDWGFKCFTPINVLRDHCRGLLVNDTCIIVAEVYVPKSEDKEHTCITASQTSRVQDLKPEPIEHTDTEVQSTSIGDLVDFRGLGKIEKAFVPMLEEVCSRHPSLIECQEKRSLKFTEWAFTALGRVLHFLKTKKGKDMNEDACKDLEVMWEELEMFRFDLTWLEPHVRSALGMKSYMERAAHVEKLEEDVVALESVVKMLKLKADATAVVLAMAVRDLSKAKAGLQKGNLDAELGYGMP